jgi:hypothetical protein
MLRNYPIIFVSGSHYCIKKERRQKFSPDHKHSNLSSREIVCVRSQLPSPASHFELVPTALWFQIPSTHPIQSSLRSIVTRLLVGQPRNRVFDYRYETTAFFWQNHSVRLWAPLNFLFSSYMGLYERDKNGRAVKLTTGHHLVLKLRMTDAIPLVSLGCETHFLSVFLLSVYFIVRDV